MTRQFESVHSYYCCWPQATAHDWIWQLDYYIRFRQPLKSIPSCTYDYFQFCFCLWTCLCSYCQFIIMNCACILPRWSLCMWSDSSALLASCLYDHYIISQTQPKLTDASLCPSIFCLRATLPSKPPPASNSDKSKAPSKPAGSKKPGKPGAKQGNIMSFFKKIWSQQDVLISDGLAHQILSAVTPASQPLNWAPQKAELDVPEYIQVEQRPLREGVPW
jgi:hypothetical protein